MTLRVNGQILMLSDLKQSTGESRDVPEEIPTGKHANVQLPMMILPRGSNNTKQPAHRQSKPKTNAMKNIGGAFIGIKHVVSGHGHVHDASGEKHPTYSTRSNSHWQCLCATQLVLIDSG